MSTTYDVYNDRLAHEAEIFTVNGITKATSLISDVEGRKASQLSHSDILKQAAQKLKRPANEINTALHFPFLFAMIACSTIETVRRSASKYIRSYG